MFISWISAISIDYIPSFPVSCEKSCVKSQNNPCLVKHLYNLHNRAVKETADLNSSDTKYK